MKKLFTSMAMLALVASSASAQWTPSDTKYIIVGTDSVYRQSGLKSLHTPQGNLVVTWTEWSQGLKYYDPLSGYYLHLQIYDQDGKAKFAKGGLIVSSKPTQSYTTDYGLSLANNGDIVLCYFDTRNDPTKSNSEIFEEATNCNGTTDGDGNYPKLGVNGDRALVIWAYQYTNPTLMANQFSLDGDYTWEGDSLLGFTVAENEQWGITPVKVIPQQNGWVMLYGDAQSWNGANFYVEKIDDNGRTMWKKQIAENDFKSSGFSVTYDDQYAYIFYTCDKEIDDNREEIPGPGGLRLMVVDITDSTNGIAAPTTEQTDAAQAVYYNAQGMQVNDTTLPGLYLVKQGNNVKKVIVK